MKKPGVGSNPRKQSRSGLDLTKFTPKLCLARYEKQYNKYINILGIDQGRAKIPGRSLPGSGLDFDEKKQFLIRRQEKNGPGTDIKKKKQIRIRP